MYLFKFKISVDRNGYDTSVNIINIQSVPINMGIQ